MAQIYLLDGTAIAYRSFYGVRDLSTSTGQKTNAIYGFVNGFFRMLEKHHPHYAVVAFDLKGPTFRHEMFREYKIQRKPMPDELSEQIPVIKEILNLLGVKILEMENYEADDIIGTLSSMFKSADNEISIVTSDKDMLQLLCKNVEILNPGKNEVQDVTWFLEKFGFPPEKMVDFIALAGDQSDNIPGIRGIGEKTAMRLIQEFGSLDNLYADLQKVKSETLRKKIENGKQQAFMSKELATIKRDLPINLDMKNIRIADMQLHKLMQLFERLEFRKLIERLRVMFPDKSELKSLEQYINFSNGEVIEYKDILREPEIFRMRLEDEKLEKYGFNLKNKMVELARKDIQIHNASFDLTIARYITNYVASSSTIAGAIEEYKKVLAGKSEEKLFYDIEMPLIKVLFQMEMNGIKVNKEYLDKLSGDFSSRLNQIEERIFKLSGELFNLNSPNQIAVILFEKLGLPAKKKNKTGYSTDTSVLEELSLVHPLPKLILEYREFFKLKSTYVDGMIPYIDISTGRIHPSFNQMVTTTGRLSCSNPNLQNIPVRTEYGSLIRKAFCVDGNNILYSFDYSQIELRILAHFSKDSQLVEAFRLEKDIHQETADILFTISSLFAKPVELNKNVNLRRIAKTINFGVIYGMSPYGLSKEVGIPVGQAAKFIDSYFEKFSGVKKYIDGVIEKTEKAGFAETIFGRRRYIPEIRSRERSQKEFGKRAAINMPIQGTAADIIKLAMVRIEKEFTDKGIRSKMVLQIHDELLFEVIANEEKTVYRIVKDIMENVVSLNVPIFVDVKKGKNYLEMN